jgi:hypothetical protein
MANPRWETLMKALLDTNPLLEVIADANTPTQRCVEALEPVVRRLLADNIPPDTIISTLAGLAKLTILLSVSPAPSKH